MSVFDHFHQKVKWWGTIVLMSPITVLVMMVGSDPFMSLATGRLPRYILSGGLFSDKFDIRHAGFCLDQPTIGKWLFWFTVMAALSSANAAIVRLISDRRSRFGAWAFAVPLAVICAFLLCILSWPMSWLVQYIHSMGVTPNRIFGLVYGAAVFIGVIVFFIWAIRRPKTAGNTKGIF